MSLETRIKDIFNSLADEVSPSSDAWQRLSKKARSKQKQRLGLTSALTVIVFVLAGLGLAQLRSSEPPIIQPSGRADQESTAVALTRARWSVIPRSPIGARTAPMLIWDGRELLEIGGTSGGVPRGDGAAYDPAVSRWRHIATAPVQVGTVDAASVWTGSVVFMFGGRTPPYKVVSECCVAGLYDPKTDRWAVSSRAPLDKGLMQTTAVWTGGSVVLAGLRPGNPEMLEAASYDPTADRWVRLDPAISQSHPPLDVELVATDQGVVLWSLWGRTQQTGPGEFTGYAGVDVYRLDSSGRWRNVTDGWPQHETVSGPLFTGAKILLPPGQIWCGACSHPAPMNEHGYLVDPQTLNLMQIPHGPLDDLGPQVVWTGAAEVSLNPGGESEGPAGVVRPGDVAVWNPGTGAWTRGPRAPNSLQDDPPPVWGLDRLFALGIDGRLLAFGASRR